METTIEKEKKVKRVIPMREIRSKKDIDEESLYSWEEFKYLVPFGRSKWYEMIKVGKAPKPIKMGQRSIRWRGASILHWVENLEEIFSD